VRRETYHYKGSDNPVDNDTKTNLHPDFTLLNTWWSVSYRILHKIGYIMTSSPIACIRGPVSILNLCQRWRMFNSTYRLELILQRIFVFAGQDQYSGRSSLIWFQLLLQGKSIQLETDPETLISWTWKSLKHGDHLYHQTLVIRYQAPTNEVLRDPTLTVFGWR
jgi:hypothetical protein